MTDRRNPHDRPASHNDKGIDEVLRIIRTLNDAGIVSCIVGGKALRYFGVHRIPTDWHICVSNDQFTKASAIFASLGDEFEPGSRILPQLKSLIHTYPRFKQKGVNFSFYILPANEYFVSDLDESMIERSHNDIPYPKLEYFAQSLVSTQRWPQLDQLVDGMDLDESWGMTHLQLGTPSQAEMEYVADKNRKIMSSCGDYPNVIPSLGKLTTKALDRSKKWKETVEGKERRIGPYLSKERYATQFRRKGSEDPRKTRDV
ncbi:hypothetical protein F4777DRAFT_484797 [Nemania sp. FL0916]|nr:hypothetical protein F4777DRAFT_484797 [Nemania sp. FL0916]